MTYVERRASGEKGEERGRVGDGEGETERDIDRVTERERERLRGIGRG